MSLRSLKRGCYLDSHSLQSRWQFPVLRQFSQLQPQQDLWFLRSFIILNTTAARIPNTTIPITMVAKFPEINSNMNDHFPLGNTPAIFIIFVFANQQINKVKQQSDGECGSDTKASAGKQHTQLINYKRDHIANTVRYQLLPMSILRCSSRA